MCSGEATSIYIDIDRQIDIDRYKQIARYKQIDRLIDRQIYQIDKDRQIQQIDKDRQLQIDRYTRQIKIYKFRKIERYRYLFSLIQQHDVCVRVCLLPIFSGTAGPIWLNFFCQLRLGHGMVLSQIKSGSGIRIFRKSGKTRFLG